MTAVRITVVVDIRAAAPLLGEFGLSLLLEYGAERILFDVGSGAALTENLHRLGIDPAQLDRLILSHGHYDHTTGLEALLPRMPQATVFYGVGIDASHHSLRDDLPMRSIAMPEAARRALFAHPRRREIDRFTEIAAGMFLTGPIPRISGEDCGGRFYLNMAGTVPDSIADEQALLLAEGILISGCCHAGVINTMEYCLQTHPEIPIHAVVGGLHLLHAGEPRLRQTADYLKHHAVRQLVLLHCTGDEAVAFLRDQLPECNILTPSVGETVTL